MQKTPRCPNCGDGLHAQTMAGGHFPVEIDVCYACHAFWFDHMESPQLSDSAVLKLFELIHQHKDQQRRPLGAKLVCPRCPEKLVRTQDIQRSNKIEYYRCPKNDGRFTTWFHFLREKNFVRSLTAPELKQLRVQVSQVRCSSCGAMVSLEKDAACAHCRAPVSILDADAIQKTITELKEGAKTEQQPIQVRKGDFPEAGRSKKIYYEEPEWARPAPYDDNDNLSGDLMVHAIDGLIDWLSSRK